MRLTYALLLSLLIHTLLLNLTFSGLGWIPGVGFSRQVQTFPVPDVRVVLVPPDAATKGKATAVAQPPQQVLAIWLYATRPHRRLRCRVPHCLVRSQQRLCREPV